MPTIAELISNIHLQLAAEASLNNASTSSSLQSALERGNLHSSMFTSGAAVEFAQRYTVVSQAPDNRTGFSGTLFRDNLTGELTISFRSTEFIDDAARDCQATNKLEVKEFGWAFGQIADMETWYKSLLASNQLPAGTPLSVTGYSLGGHLATAFALIRREEAAHNSCAVTLENIYTFNGAGVGAMVGGASLLSTIARFDALRKVCPAFSSQAAKTIYEQYQNTRLSSDAELVEMQTTLSAAKSASSDAPGALVELATLEKALERCYLVASEALRVPTLVESPKLDAKQPLDVPLAKIEAASLDYQLAVLAVGSDTVPVSASVIDGLLGTAQGKRVHAADPIIGMFDVYGDTYPSMTATSQMHYGQPLAVMIENQPLYRGTVPQDVLASLFNRLIDPKLIVNNYGVNDWGDTHSLVLMIDSLTVMKVLATLDPSISMETCGLLFNSISYARASEQKGTQGHAKGDCLELMADSLATALGCHVAALVTPDTTAHLNAGGTWADIDARNALHDKVAAIQLHIANTGLEGAVKVEPIAGCSAEQLVTKIREGGLAGAAYFAAVRDGLSFALIPTLSDLALPELSQNSDQLTLANYSEKLGPASEAWLMDRALMYSEMLANNGNLIIKNPAVAAPWVFEDKVTGLTYQRGIASPSAGLDYPYPKNVSAFNTDAGGELIAGELGGHLYGGLGADTLKGSSNADVLVARGVAQGGADYIYAESGDDLIVTEGKAIAYGETGDDTLVSNGQLDLLVGGEGDDILEAHATASELQGNTGDDTLTSVAADVTLKGGTGFDTYQVVSGDIVLDEDNAGKVVLEGNLLAGGEWDALSDGWVGANGELYTRTSPTTLTVTTNGTKEPLVIENFSFLRAMTRQPQFPAGFAYLSPLSSLLPLAKAPLGITLERPREAEQELATLIRAAQGTAAPRYFDPLIVDLDGNGLATTARVEGPHFDMAADGFAEKTGWLAPGDAFVVRDLNNNGVVDSGRELFGDQTILPNGALAAQGFAALAALDSNSDGQFNSADQDWANVKLWRDNGDGQTQASELLAMTDAGIGSITLSASRVNQIDAANNVLAFYAANGVTRSDGSRIDVGSFLLSQDSSDTVALERLALSDEVAQLPDLVGFGKMYDLSQAMMRDGSLATLVANVAVSAEYKKLPEQFEAIMLRWAGADSVGAASRGAFIDARHLTTIERFYGQGFIGDLGANPNANAAVLLEAAYRQLKAALYSDFLAQAQLAPVWATITTHVDSQTGAVSQDYAKTAAYFEERALGTSNMELLSLFASNALYEGLANKPGFDLFRAQLLAANAAYSEAVTLGLAGRSIILASESGGTLEGTNNDDLMIGGSGADVLMGGPGNDVLIGGAGDDTLNGGSGVDSLQGSTGNDTLGGVESWEQYNTTVNGNPYLWDNQPPNLQGNEYIGGPGNDKLNGTFGADIYRFNLGDGQDLIEEPGTAYGYAWGSQDIGTDILQLGPGIRPEDISVRREGANLILEHVNHEDKLTIKWWFADVAPNGRQVELIKFEDGTTWTNSQLSTLALNLVGSNNADVLIGAPGFANVISGGAGDDVITGGYQADVLTGGAGNDRLSGDAGADLIDGGPGDDVLRGDAGSDILLGGEGNDVLGSLDSTEQYGAAGGHYGNPYFWYANPPTVIGNSYTGGSGDDTLNGTFGADTYYFNLGDGKDLIIEPGLAYDSYNRGQDFGADVLKLGPGINPDDVQVLRQGSDLVLRHVSGQDQVTIKDWFFAADSGRKLAAVTFEDGTTWLEEQLTSRGLSVTGTSGPDVLTGLNDWSNTLNGGAGNDVLTGGNLSDVLKGGEGDDRLNGGAGVDFLFGEAGDDTLGGTDSADQYGAEGGYYGNPYYWFSVAPTFTGNTYEGGAGNDQLNGTYGADTFRFRLGDGKDVIVEPGAAYGSAWRNKDLGADVLTLGPGITPADMLVVRNGLDLTLAHINGQDQITIRNWFVGTGYQLSVVQFEDGTNWTTTDVMAKQMNNITGASGDDVLSGSAANDYIQGNAGNDALSGGAGNDAVYGGPGNDTLYGGTGIDVLAGGPGIDTIYRQDGGAKVIVFNLGDGQDTVYDWHSYGQGPLDTVFFGNGIVPDSVEPSFEGADLVIKVAGSAEVLRLAGYRYTAAPIATFRFSNGVTWSDADMQAAQVLPFSLGAGAQSLWLSMPLKAIKLGAGITADNLVVTTSPNGGLRLAVSGAADVLDISCGNPETEAVRSLVFADGTVWSASIMDSHYTFVESTPLEPYNYLAGTVAHPNVIGFEGNDMVWGLNGELTVTTGDGDDVVIMRAMTTVFSGNVTGVSRTLVLGPGITADQLKLGVSDNSYVMSMGGVPMDLKVSVEGTTGSMTFSGFLDPWSAVYGAALTNLRFSDGTTWSAADIRQQLSPAPDENGIVVGADNSIVLGPEAGGVILAGNGLTEVLTGNGANIVIGGIGSTLIQSGSGMDYLRAGQSNSVMFDPSGGVNIQQGLAGNDRLSSWGGWDMTTGQQRPAVALLTGGAGADALVLDNGIAAGGQGDDTISTWGTSAILFNRGDGNDVVLGYSTLTISLGGGITAADVSISREGDGLKLLTGLNEGLLLDNWFAPWMNHSGVELQLVPASGNDSVQTADLAQFAAELADVQAIHPETTELRFAAFLHEAGSSTFSESATGGAIAYRFGQAGGLAGMTIEAAQAVLSDPLFGQKQTVTEADVGAANPFKLL